MREGARPISLRGARWRGIRYADGEEELYDRKVDPKGKQLTSDGVHMNKAGNIMMARGVAKVFGLTDQQLDKSAENWK